MQKLSHNDHLVQRRAQHEHRTVLHDRREVQREEIDELEHVQDRIVPCKFAHGLKGQKSHDAVAKEQYFHA